MCEENGEFEEIKKKKKFSKAPQCSDLIVLGLPYHTTEADLKQFFSEYGEVAFVDVSIISAFLSYKWDSPRVFCLEFSFSTHIPRDVN